ncbi:hypothetical protein HMN09_00860300 [Mycena chlorophos]|uniref:F-box domain-containing protein n=1 Tax=Mycena chlorophos TaxID=658473 RepID=A0A8H6W6E1_MYCCL|nr:hypothetical protein HMN09_00860300 [Mycena chlorophos]
MQNLVPRLPLELEREIFELSAWHDKPTMLVLILVASRVRVWIEPLLHRVIRIRTREQFKALHERLTNNATYCASVCHVLFTGASWPELYHALEYILRECTNLVDLGIWVGDAWKTPPAAAAAGCAAGERQEPRNFLEVASPRLSRLSLMLEDLTGVPGALIFAPDLRCFTSVTHLDLVDFNPQPPAILALLKRPVLPSLACLAIADADIELCRAILALPRPLRILCIYGELVPEHIEATIPDPRFCVVYAADSQYSQAIGSTLRGANAGLWELAERRVETRRRNAVEAASASGRMPV